MMLSFFLLVHSLKLKVVSVFKHPEQVQCLIPSGHLHFHCDAIVLPAVFFLIPISSV